jgi:hypothetical protein
LAILQTVAYADVFDYPLTIREVHRYLVRIPTSPLQVEKALLDGQLAGRLSFDHKYVTLPGRESLIKTRLRREKASAQLWRKGRRYGLAISSLPFVRLVAITGTLAVNNAEGDADIDYLIVTAPRRVWLTRFFVLALVYLARLEQVTLCPNYVISLDALQKFEHTFFTAHELAQMIPLYGLDVYRQLVQANNWARQFLPNAFDEQFKIPQRRAWHISHVLKHSAEWMLGGMLGDLWERAESRTRIKRLSQQAAACDTCAATFAPDQCKGHMEDHGYHIQEAYMLRLEQAGLDSAGLL